MSRALLQATQVRVNLAVNLEVNSPAGAHLVTLSLLPLTWLVMVVWQAALLVNRLRYEWVMLRQDITEAAAVTGKLLAIAFNSWAWALGVQR